MSRASLEFDLPEERSEFMMAFHGQDSYCNLIDIDNFCRNTLKHQQISQPFAEALEEIRRMCRNNNVQLGLD
jgi:hypothetical protein